MRYLVRGWVGVQGNCVGIWVDVIESGCGIRQEGCEIVGWVEQS